MYTLVLSTCPLHTNSGCGKERGITNGLFFFLGDVAFSEYFLYHFRFLFVVWTIEYVVRSFVPNGVFLPCDHGLDF